MNVIEAGGGRCICELKISEEHQNRSGMLHGGMTATLVDIVSTAALMSNDNTGPGVSVDMSISLVSIFCCMLWLLFALLYAGFLALMKTQLKILCIVIDVFLHQFSCVSFSLGESYQDPV